MPQPMAPPAPPVEGRLQAGFHKAAEAALHRLGQHRVLYLHSQEVTSRLAEADREFLEGSERQLVSLIRRGEGWEFWISKILGVLVENFGRFVWLMTPGSHFALSFIVAHPSNQ